jgi:hypothetical protein
VTRAAAMRLLFVYITDRGGLSFVVAGSVSVHAWCMGDVVLLLVRSGSVTVLAIHSCCEDSSTHVYV